jgi:UDP-N-acetylmuramate--alanine ligase
VAGSHGKTTTTSMIALVLERAGLDPTAVIGGRLSAFGSNARLGGGELIVAEADESDGSFLKLSPTIAVVTNIDYEHLEHYGGFDELQQAFVDFANKVPFYGGVVACLDDPHLANVLPRVTRRLTTYGVDGPADLVGTAIELGPLGSTATVERRGLAHGGSARASTTLGTLSLSVPGRHNLLNALAAVAVGLELGLTFDRIAAGLGEFRGAERRFELRGEPRGILVVDDYGHHPTEIRAVLEAARVLKRRIVVAFQPHRYTPHRPHGYLRRGRGAHPGCDARCAGRGDSAWGSRACRNRPAVGRCDPGTREDREARRRRDYPWRRLDWESA